jgi:DNA-binding NarL/FixJ family response regulator
MLSRPTNLAIVCSQALFGKTLNKYLSEQSGLNVLALAQSAYDLLNQLKNVSIEVLVMNFDTPQMNEIEGIRAIRKRNPGIKIILLAASVSVYNITNLLDFGIHGFLSHSDEPEELVKAIYTVSEGQIYRSRLLAQAFYFRTKNNIGAHREENHPLLSDREKTILQLIWEEKSNREIAEELFLGVRSVEKIRQEMKTKIQAKSTVGLLKYGIGRGIINEQMLQTRTCQIDPAGTNQC